MFFNIFANAKQKDPRVQFKKKISKYFSRDAEIANFIMRSEHVDEFLAFNEKISFKDIIRFIDKYEESIISSGLEDEMLKNELLTEDGVIYRTKESKINRDYYKTLLDNIRNRKFDPETITLFLDIMKMITIYGIDCKEDRLRSFLEDKIYATVKNGDLISAGNRILSVGELQEKSDKLLNWCKLCGNSVVDKVFSLDLLLERLSKLQSSERKDISPYKDQISKLIACTQLAISIREDGKVPSVGDIGAINSLFSLYEQMNHELILSSLNNEDYHLIHFVQTEEVDYRIVGDNIVDVNIGFGSEAEYNKEQNDFFISSYLEKAKIDIEQKTGEPFDMANMRHRALLQTYLDYYNSTFNNNPLARLPMDIREMGKNFKDYVRPSSSRLSCSFVSKDKVKSHLDRKVGLIIRPKTPNDILSTSLAYTSNKDYQDFKGDSVSYLDLIYQIDHSKKVNECCVDASQCEVIAVVLLGNEESSLIRAEHLAEMYQVEVVRMENQKQF